MLGQIPQNPPLWGSGRHLLGVGGVGSPSVLCSGLSPALLWGIQWALCREPLGLGRDGASKGAAPNPPSLLGILLPE